MKIWKDKLFIAIVAVIIVLIFMIAKTSAGKNTITVVEKAVGVITNPIQKAFYAIGSKVSTSFSDVLNYKNILEENKQLKQEINAIKEENRQVYQLEIENKTLRDMLNFVEDHQEYEYKGVNIISKDPGNWFESFVIDKGSNDGIKVNDAVIMGSGLVGRVIEVSSTFSKVVSIIDERSSISALVNRTRDTGIATGNSDKGITAVMPLHADIINGDELVTSEYSNFPKGLYIGRVINVTTDEGKSSKMVEIEPGVDFERLEQVFVVKEK